MTSLRFVLMAAATLTLVGCGGDIVGPAGDGGTDVAPTDAPPVDVPRVCVTSADCANGQECLVHEGCGTPSYCGPLLGRACTDDIAFYCGCDYMTFTASSTCPTRSFMYRGRCEGSDSGPPPPPPPPPGCELPDGTICPVGARCPAGDGCNTCTCDRFGNLACTEIGCVDAAPPPGCTLADGTFCRVGQTCPLGACASCYCAGPDRALCTGGGCTDAGQPVDASVDVSVDIPVPRSCTSTRDCPPSMICDGPLGCGTIWSCVAARPCTADLAPFCGCDGRTFMSSSSCPGQKYEHRGACP